MDNVATVTTASPVRASDPAFPVAAIIVVASAAYIAIIILLLVLMKLWQSRGRTISCPRCPEVPGCCECQACTSETSSCSQVGRSVGEGCGCADPPKTCNVCAARYCPSFENCRCNEFHSCGCFFTPNGRFRLPCPTCPTDYCPSCPQCPPCPELCQPAEEEFQCPSFTCPSCPACPDGPEFTCQCQMPECETINCLCFEIAVRQPGGTSNAVPTRGPTRDLHSRGASMSRR